MLVKRLIIILLILVSGQVKAQSDIGSKRAKFITHMNKVYADNFDNSYCSIEDDDIFVQTQSARDLVKASGLGVSESNVRAMKNVITTPSDFKYYVENNVKQIRNNKKMKEFYILNGFKYIRIRVLVDGKLYKSKIFAL